MNQAKLIVNPEQGFALSQEKMPSGDQTIVKMLDRSFFCDAIKVNQHVGAENQVESLHEHDLGLVLQIQPVEFDGPAHRILHAVEIALLLEIFVAHLRA